MTSGPQGPSIGQALVQAGLERHGAGDREGAEACFRRAVAAQSDEPTALYLLGLLRFEIGDGAEATALIEQVVALRPDHAPSWLALANLRSWRGDSSAAARAYRRAAALTPGQAAALIGLSQALLANGDQAGALAAGEAATAAADDAGSHLALAAALASLGRRQDAAEAYRAAIRCQSDLVAAHIGLAVALVQLNETDAALASAERAVALAGGALAWFALGVARRAACQWASAAVALERSIAIDPGRAAAHLSLGVVYLELEQLALAERQLLRVLEFDPGDSEAHASLSTLYSRADRFEAGRRHALLALERDPDMVVAHQNLAAILSRDGQDEAARRHRDLAFGRLNLFVAATPRAAQRVLILSTTDSGNVPDRHLLPSGRYTRIYWFIEYAQPGQAGALPPYDVVFNAIADQDYAGPTADKVAAFLGGCGRPVFNAPDRIARTRRDLAPALFSGVEGLVTPRVARLAAESCAELGLARAARLAGVRPPLLIRPIRSHGGQGLVLLPEGAEPGAAIEVTPGRDHYVTVFHDFRSADGLYRKYRVIFIDRRPYPYHLAIGSDWMVHYEASGAANYPERLDEERRFLADPEGALGRGVMQVLRAVGERMDLDFCGVDFSVQPDGRLLLFEANATMLVHPEAPDGPLAHKNPYVDRIVVAFQSMLARA